MLTPSPLTEDGNIVVGNTRIRAHEIRSESEGFFTLVTYGTDIADDGVLIYHVQEVEHITQKSVAYLMELLGLKTETQVKNMLIDHVIGVEKRRDGRDRISSDPAINPWMRNYLGYHTSSPE